ncbi:MAG TPA: hypothetical protein VFJ25_11500 [Casimicrobiaceae bacterium]|nr:hypothetical protein [Casimicrobiaceae bacterium]
MADRQAIVAKDQLAALAQALKSLHRALAERVRRDAEAREQTVIMPGQWLSRLTGDAQFAWLRSLSELMVDLDVFLDADPAPAADDMAAIRAEVERTIAPSTVSGTESDFSRHYWHYVHEEPNVGAIHGELRRALDRLPEPADVDETDALHERHKWTAARRQRK